MRIVSVVIAVLAGLTVPALAQDATPIFDHAPFFKPGTQSSDDVQRVVMPDVDASAPTGSIVLVGGRVFDGTGAAARPATLVITGKRIAALLSPGRTGWPADAQVIDVAGKTVMPGLIDAHVHLTYVESFGLPVPLSDGNAADSTLRGINRMRILVHSGVTTVRDMASHGQVPFALKRWQAEGRIEGPRILPVGQLITAPGGHGTEGFAMATAPEQPNAALRIVTGADAWREAVRIQFRQGADAIKLASHFSQAEVDAAVEEAHSLGLPVAVDAETQYIDRALKAGADDIEHPLPRSDAAIALMARRGVFSVPTLIPYRYINAINGGYTGSTSRRFTISDATIFEMFRKLKKAGVKMGVGTDLVVDWMKYFPDAYIAELKNFVAGGYTVPEALVAATKTNSEVLHMADRIGTLAPGKLADVIVVDGRPDMDLDDLKKLSLVIVNGRTMVESGAIVARPVVPVTPPVLGFDPAKFK